MDALDRSTSIRRLIFWTIPLAILAFQFVTVQWNDAVACAAYGFPLPFMRWYAPSGEWMLAPFYMSVDFAFYVLIVAGLQRLVGRWFTLDRLPRWVEPALVFGVAASGYLVLGTKLAMLFMRFFHPTGTIELSGVETASFVAGAEAYSCGG